MKISTKLLYFATASALCAILGLSLRNALRPPRTHAEISYDQLIVEHDLRTDMTIESSHHIVNFGISKAEPCSEAFDDFDTLDLTKDSNCANIFGYAEPVTDGDKPLRCTMRKEGRVTRAFLSKSLTTRADYMMYVYLSGPPSDGAPVADGAECPYFTRFILPLRFPDDGTFIRDADDQEDAIAEFREMYPAVVFGPIE